MIWQSLLLRLIAGGVVAILLALSLSGAGLVLLFERHVTRTIADDLNVILKQVIAAIDVDAQGRLIVTSPPADPRFAEPLSGLYWQVADDRGELLRSRSLWDTVLKLARDTPAPGEVHQHETDGPAERRVLVVERMIQLTIAGRRMPVRVAVAGDLGRVAAAATAFSWDLAAALAILGLVLVTATAIQVTLGLRPLASLRQGVADIRAGRIRYLAPAAPVEVQPLVAEVNSLLDEQERVIERSRSRAADLAHGLKTPLAALAGDVRRLRAEGQTSIASDIESVAEDMSRHVDRELARARVGAVRRNVSVTTELAPLVQSLVGTLARTPSGARVLFEQRIVDALFLPIDRTDLAEVLGNILENAARHAKSRVRITAPVASMIVIEDDGPGVSAEARTRVLERGIRLDQRKDGAGLGLAIVQDVLEAYGWHLVLGASHDLGGLQAMIAPVSASISDQNVSGQLTNC
jgi:signal transduction histidine kinase